jgi:1,4-alpha-glucan branching enzyme
VELTNQFGRGDERHLRPLVSDDGPVLWPIDRETISLVWSDSGYPAGAAYRDHHRLTTHHHRAWRNDGGEYDPAIARGQAERDAADFVARVRERVAGGGLCVFALDTELLGHWWYEGVSWLSAVLDETARQGLDLVTLDDAIERYEPNPAPDELGVTSWGEGGDLRTWSGPRVAEAAWRARTAELRVLRTAGPIGDRPLRELLALQASDWAFLIARGGAGDYPLQRLTGHAEALDGALAGTETDAPLRNLAPILSGWGD